MNILNSISKLFNKESSTPIENRTYKIGMTQVQGEYPMYVVIRTDSESYKAEGNPLVSLYKANVWSFVKVCTQLLDNGVPKSNIRIEVQGAENIIEMESRLVIGNRLQENYRKSIKSLGIITNIIPQMGGNEVLVQYKIDPMLYDWQVEKPYDSLLIRIDQLMSGMYDSVPVED